MVVLRRAGSESLSFSEWKDSKLVSLRVSKSFGKARVTKKREKCKEKNSFFFFPLPSASTFGKAKVTKKRENSQIFMVVFGRYAQNLKKIL